MLIGDTFKAWVQFNRIVHIRGRLGGGKTLLAVAIADWMLREGIVDQVWTNFPCQLTRPVRTLHNTCIILDEAWQWLDWRVTHKNESHSYAAFLRKINAFLLLPSVRSLVGEVSDLKVYRFLDLTHIGVPMWIYRARWVLDKDDVETTYAFLWNPSKYFGLYDTSFIPSDDGNIPRLLKETIDAQRKGKI
ncbi:MAG: hypothetical protein QXQ53_07590 [Candidatus Methanosuratincola sp.]